MLQITLFPNKLYNIVLNTLVFSIQYYFYCNRSHNHIINIYGASGSFPLQFHDFVLFSRFYQQLFCTSAQNSKHGISEGTDPWSTASLTVYSTLLFRTLCYNSTNSKPTQKAQGSHYLRPQVQNSKDEVKHRKASITSTHPFCTIAYRAQGHTHYRTLSAI